MRKTSLVNKLGSKIVAGAVALGLIAYGLKEPVFAFPDANGLPRPNVGTDGYASVPDWIKHAAKFHTEFGIKYPGDGWDIGAFEFYPGRYPNMPLIHNPEEALIQNLFAFNLRVTLESQGTNNPSGPATNYPSISESLSQKLGTLYSKARALPQDQWFVGLRDFFTNNCQTKFFFDRQGIACTFYYNGTLGGKQVNISDHSRTTGFQGDEYIKLTEPNLPFGTNWFTAKFSANEELNLKALRNGKTYSWLFLEDYSKTIKFDYGAPLFKEVLGSDEAAQRGMTGNATEEEASLVNLVLNRIVKGTASTNYAQHVKMSFERTYFGHDPVGYELYEKTLEHIIAVMP